MASNMLAGSGPTMSPGGMADGPSPGVAGSLGATPQASPTPQGNAFTQQRPGAGGLPPPPGGQGPGQPPPTPPSLPTLIDVFHKQAYTVNALKGLLSKPDLKTKDILEEVGDAVAEGIMGPFDAANQLKTMPPGDDSLSLRKWVGQHYSNAVQAMQTVSEMIEAHGHMTRRVAALQAAQPPQMPQTMN